MNPREILARLNVPAVRYDIGRGGTPELTNVDIAAALGMVSDVFAREVFTAIWWPDGAQLSRNEVGRLIFERLLAEYVKRERAITAARLELHMAEGDLAMKRFPTEYDLQVVANCRRNRDITKARHWPWNPAVYARMGNAVIEERKVPAHCPACRGRSEAIIDGKLVKCPQCVGTGIKNRPAIWRAAQLGITDTGFVERWGNAYEWTVNLVSDAESVCARSLREILARDSQAVA